MIDDDNYIPRHGEDGVNDVVLGNSQLEVWELSFKREENIQTRGGWGQQKEWPEETKETVDGGAWFFRRAKGKLWLGSTGKWFCVVEIDVLRMRHPLKHEVFTKGGVEITEMVGYYFRF